ncbi:hypothetical protein DSO57_1010704 [Entomophthora muscae]|uniref:Uncharacterized protein n=1 Tax=Entomophthora muscae TaxID=34485 RepID=A0ACC2T6D6_9FUNG|nr:hypothetical protein DSO57_1010704 [Entomophthora muscae]
MADREIEALRAREEKSVEIMACWWDDNKVLSEKIASLEAKLFKALSQEGQDNGRMDWLGLDLSHKGCQGQHGGVGGAWFDLD